MVGQSLETIVVSISKVSVGGTLTLSCFRSMKCSDHEELVVLLATLQVKELVSLISCVQAFTFRGKTTVL